MAIKIKSFPLIFLLAITWFLTGCLGGGGGSGKNGSAGEGLSLSVASISFAASSNAPVLPASQDVSISYTGSDVYSVVLGYPPEVSIPSWLTLSSIGNGNPLTLRLSVNTTSLAPATYSTTVRVASRRIDESIIAYRDVAVSYVVSAALNLNPAELNSHKLSVSANGIALASMPTVSHLNHTVVVSDAADIATQWTASADRPWLTVTPGGSAGDKLVLSANPQDLAIDAIHYATVTVQSSDPSISAATIRVGLHVGSSDPLASWTIPTDLYEYHWVTDPVRPYVYVATGKPTIDVYHIYTGAKVATIEVPGIRSNQMMISADGALLYVEDVSGNERAQVNIGTEGNTTSPWEFARFEEVQPNGAPLLSSTLKRSGIAYPAGLRDGTDSVITFIAR